MTLTKEEVQAAEKAWLESAAEYAIPKHTAFTIMRWVLYGIEGSSFFKAVLEGKLTAMYYFADGQNRKAIGNIARFKYDRFPPGSYGEGYENWTGLIEL